MHSTNSTLHSKIKVLIARTHRAQSLYDSISVSDYSSAKLKELATSVGAKVWKESNQEFRSDLNRALKGSDSLYASLCDIRDSYIKRLISYSEEIIKRKSVVEIANQKDEFKKVIINAVSLLELRASIQCLEIIIKEIESVVGKSEIELNQADMASEEESKIIEFPRSAKQR